MQAMAALLQRLHLRVFERGWLSSNNVLFQHPSHPSVLIDTGYATHAQQTLALVRSTLAERQLDWIVNTHLHSDHCGGNTALQAAFPNVRTSVPIDTFAAVQRWDEEKLTFRLTSQRCDPFTASDALSPGDELHLGDKHWQVHAAGGHDATALMFFEPSTRVLISADALWEQRLAIVFPALEGADGFGSNWETLNAIERLNPSLVIPGHGSPFTKVAAALEASRSRLARYKSRPEDHVVHARRALVMFHMLEHQQRDEEALLLWMRHAPILHCVHRISDEDLRATLKGLFDSGALVRYQAPDGGRVRVSIPR